MLGGKVIVAMRGDNYTASEGLDLDLGYKVDEFIINSTARAFRHWQKPYSDASDADFPGTVTSRDAHRRRLSKGSFKVNVTDDGCYTYLRFEIHDIGGQYFQFEGTDTFMWAANDVDTFMQHHMDNRGIFTIDWNNVGSTGEGEEGHGHAHGEKDEEGAGDTGNTTSSSNTWKATVAGAILMATSAATLM
jgi:hypothetical protein